MLEAAIYRDMGPATEMSGGSGLVDQRHAALGHAVTGEKTLVGLHQHVENRIADPENVVFCVSHRSVLFTALHERLRPTRSAPRQQGKRLL